MTIALLFSGSLFCQAFLPPPPISQMRYELSLIKDAFTALHPGLLRYNTPAAIGAAFADAEKALYDLQSERDYYLLLSRLAARVKCGHTYLNPWNQKEAVAGRLFSATCLPLLFKVVDRRFIVTHNLSADPSICPGDEIISFNAIPAKAALDSLLQVSRSDGRHGQGKMLDNLSIFPLDADTSNYALFDIYFPLFFPELFNAKEYRLLIKPHGKRPVSKRLQAISKKERQELYLQRFGPLPVNEAGWTFRLLDKNAAYLRLGDFGTWNWSSDYKVYLDSVFTLLKNSGISNLVIDIRGNEGGLDEARDEVLAYIMDKPSGCSARSRRLYKFLSVPDTLLPLLKTWNAEFKKPKDPAAYTKGADGLFEKTDTSKTPCPPLPVKHQLFTGSLYLLINSSNSSASFTMADIIQREKRGILIGEPTGGTKQGLNGGQFFFFYLPYSGFEIDIPLVWGAPSEHRPDEGVQPDHIVRTSQKDIVLGRDAQLRFALKKIRKHSIRP